MLGDQFHLFTVRRLLGTTVGALAFGLVLDCIARRSREGTLNPGSAIAAILPASLLVLAVRLAADRFFYELPLPFETNLKWVAVWTGYFGMWVSASLAFQMHRQGHRPELANFAPPAIPTPAARSRPVSEAAPPPEAELRAWEWVADACAAELANLPAADRHIVAGRLIARAGYEPADPGFESVAREQKVRIALARRIAARLSER